MAARALSAAAKLCLAGWLEVATWQVTELINEEFLMFLQCKTTHKLHNTILFQEPACCKYLKAQSMYYKLRAVYTSTKTRLFTLFFIN